MYVQPSLLLICILFLYQFDPILMNSPSSTYHLTYYVVSSLIMFIVYVFLSPLISNRYSMTALGGRNFYLFHFLLCLSIHNCAWNIVDAQHKFCQMQQWMTFLNKLQSVETWSLSLKASSHFYLANSFSSLMTQFSSLGLWESFPDSVHECSYGTCYVWTAVGPPCPPH